MAPLQLYKILVDEAPRPENLPKVPTDECVAVVRIPDEKVPFSFEIEFAYLNKIKKCMAEKRILDPRVKWYREEWLLTAEAAKQFIHESPSTWAIYPTDDILKRLINWKVPLFQLVTLFPRQPLGWSTEAMVTCHLLGDPIDSVASLIFTLHLTYVRMKKLRKVLAEKDCKAIALILASYDECSGTPADLMLEERLSHVADEEGGRLDLTPFREAAAELAADRATKSLPVIYAEIVFMASYAIDWSKVFAEGNHPGNWWAIEVYSISFSLLYIWIITAVFLGSVVGVTQTSLSSTRILSRLFNQVEVMTMNGIPARLPLNEKTRLSRISNAGIPTFRQDKWGFGSGSVSSGCRATAIRATKWICLLSAVIVASGTFFAWTLSALVPPEGFGCRQIGQSGGLVVWIPSFIVQYFISKFLVERGHQKWGFRLTFLKDVIVTVAILQIILVPQIGVLNRSDCWTSWGKIPLVLPQTRWAEELLKSRSKHLMPAVLWTCISIQIAFSASFAYRYRSALMVFLQTDEPQGEDGGDPSASGFQRIRNTVQAGVKMMGGLRTQLRLRRRSNTEVENIYLAAPMLGRGVDMERPESDVGRQ